MFLKCQVSYPPASGLSSCPGSQNLQVTYLIPSKQHKAGLSSGKQSLVPLSQNTQHPVSEEELRIISISGRLSMQCEKFVVKLMWEICLKNHMDQFGGLPRHHIAHYLIEVTNFIVFNQDLSKAIQTIMLLVDFSQGFKRMDHKNIIKTLFSLGIPGWLIAYHSILP